MPNRTDEELLDLLLIGLTWLQQSAKNTLQGWQGHSILSTICQLELLTGQQLTEVVLNPSPTLRSYAVRHVTPVIQPGMKSPRDAIHLSYSGENDKWLIAVYKDTFYDGGIFAPRGYKLTATLSGQRRALALAKKYEPGLTNSSFMHHWRDSRRHAPRW